MDLKEVGHEVMDLIKMDQNRKQAWFPEYSIGSMHSIKDRIF
jgi:hypothetical protein